MRWRKLGSDLIVAATALRQAGWGPHLVIAGVPIYSDEEMSSPSMVPGNPFLLCLLAQAKSLALQGDRLVLEGDLEHTTEFLNDR